MGLAVAQASPLNNPGITKQKDQNTQSINTGPIVQGEVQIVDQTPQQQGEQLVNEVNLSGGYQTAEGVMTVGNQGQQTIEVVTVPEQKHPRNYTDLDDGVTVSSDDVTLGGQTKYSNTGVTTQQPGQPSKILDENQLSIDDSPAQTQQRNQSGEDGLQREAQSTGSNPNLDNTEQPATNIGTLLAPGQISKGGTLLIGSPALLG